MATRSRRSAANNAHEEEQEEASASGLRFNKSLVSRPGKTISVGDLLSRLKTLSEELRTLEQEEPDRDSLEPVAKQLATPGLLSHKDAGVRACAASCIVDMFRVCAPNAPYTAAQLKEIFTLIVMKIIPLLADPSNPYNSQHLYILKSLAEVKSIVLLGDIPNSDALTTNLFTICFDVLSGPSKTDSGEELSKNVEHHMTSMLSTLIDESTQVSQDVTDVILAQFLRADVTALGAGSAKGKKVPTVDANQSTLLMKEAPPPYNMAKNICNTCPDKMARAIGSYFSNVIVDATTGSGFRNRGRNRAGSEGGDSDAEVQTGPSEEDLNEAAKAHRLLRELWRCCPGVLQEIIPHLQEELGAENVNLRQMATETFGDMISGIGAAGPPPPPVLNPLAYPSQSLLPQSDTLRVYNFLTTPTSPNSFPMQHPAAYSAFLQRKHDKSPIIRASWTTGIGRILMTSAGGVGLDPEEEKRLLRFYADMLIDGDDRVRLAALKAIEHFEFNAIVQKLGTIGGMSEPGSILANLADRVKDRKNVIRTESMRILGRIWGVAAGAIAKGNERINSLLGLIPSRILEAQYVNDREISTQIDLTMFDSLLPLGYPPMKARAALNGSSQKESGANLENTYTEADLDKIRAERELVLVRGLEEKAKKVFFAKQANQAAGAAYMDSFLKRCEEFNGGIMGKDQEIIERNLTVLIKYYSTTLPDAHRVINDLWSFAKAHDRRSYQLIRFCMAPDSDYRKVFRSIKELRKRLEENSTTKLSATIADTLIPLVYRVSLLCYNKSHLPAIIEYSRTDENGLGATAHEILKEVSTKHPKVFSTHVQELCRALESEAPSKNKPNGPGAVDDLKACSSFARKFPKDLPNERKFIQSMIGFALYGTPPKAAKHAITIIMSSATKKEMHAKDLLKDITTNFEKDSDHYLAKLAALSQLVLLAPQECEEYTDDIVDIAVNGVILKPHMASPELEAEWIDSPDDDMVARSWAIKILVNQLRATPPDAKVSDVAAPVYNLLNTMVKDGGEASKKKNTPLAHKNLQRVLAANLLLKLSCARRYDALFTSKSFNQLAIVSHDPCVFVRKGFITKLLKYLGQNRLPTRYYSILFLLAFEPNVELKESVITWIRSRRAALAARKDITLESIFPRVLSLIAHHPDFDTEPDTLKEMAQYVIFYLRTVATPDNISLIYHFAQRVKGVSDGINASASENLYVISDLAQAVIRLWEEHNGWSLQSWPGKVKLPAGIFKALESHERAQEIADRVWVDDEIVTELEPLVKSALRSKKRKAGDSGGDKRKKPKIDKAERKSKPKAERKIKTPKKWKKGADSDDEDEEADSGKRAAPANAGPRRKSGRGVAGKSYVEVSDEEEEEDQDEDGSEEDEEARSSDLSELSDDEEKEETVNKAISTTNGDIEMEDAEPEAAADHESEPDEPEPEPEPEPPKRGGRGKAAKPASPQQKKTLVERTKTATPTKSATPAKTPAKSAKGKGKEKASDVASSSPVIPTRRSTRSRG